MSDVTYLTKKSAGMVQADVEANCIEHGIRGRLKHSDIEKMVAHYTDDEKHARIEGKFHHLVGIIFKNFNRKVHVIKPFEITKKDYIVLEALDPHPRNPDAVLWVAVDKNGTKFVVDELYGTFKTSELAYRINKKADRYRLEKRIADPLAFVEDKHQINPVEQTLAGRLWDLGLEYEKATKDRRAADRRIKDALDYEMKGEEMIVAPELYVFDSCKRTIWEIEHLVWDEWRGTAAERKSPMEKPVDKDDHCMVGETLIDLENGQKTIKELVGTTGLVKTIGGCEKYFNVRKTQENTPVYRMTFSDDKFVEATGEHLILSAKNEWKELWHYKTGDKVLDIGQRVGYNGKYENNNYIFNQTRIQWRKILALWKVFQQEYEKQTASAFAPRSLAIPQWQNSQRLCCSSQGQQSGKQPNREFAFNEKREAYKLSHDTKEERVGKKQYVDQCYSCSDRVAQVSQSKMALRNVEKEIDWSKETSYLQTYLRSLWERISIYKKTKINVLFQKLQRQGIMASKKGEAKIEKIEYVGLRDVFNMEVENTHCFSVNGGIVVHNCIENLGRILVQEPEFRIMPRPEFNKSTVKTTTRLDPYA